MCIRDRFSASYGVANALEQGHMDLLSVVVEPLMEILLSLLLGLSLIHI